MTSGASRSSRQISRLKIVTSVSRVVATTGAERRPPDITAISPKKSPGPSVLITAPFVNDVSGARLNREHRVSEVPLAHEDGSLLDLELVARARDGLPLIDCQPCEERDRVELRGVHRADASDAGVALW